MSELLLLKDLFVCAYQKSPEELEKHILNILTKERNCKKKYKKNSENKVIVLDSEDEEETENEKEKEKEKEKEITSNDNDSLSGEKKYDDIKHYLDGNRNNVLHFAIYGNNYENVKFLIRNTTMIDSFNENGQNGLIISLLNKNTEISKYLIENNINYNIVDKCGCNPLLYSLITHEYKIFDILIEKENINININSEEKGNLIGICVFEKNIKILKKLFNKNISPDCENNMYPHPLIFIAHNNDNNLLYLYLTYALYYCTRNEQLKKVNEINFDAEKEEITINLNERDLIKSILENPEYNLTTFKKLLYLKDEANSSLIHICKSIGNKTGEDIIQYYSFD